MMDALTRQDLADGLTRLGVRPGMELEVHSSLGSFGWVEGGAMTVIDALKEACTGSGSLFMPALRLSPERELTDEDRALGITRKIEILPPDCPVSAMGIIADTFRCLPDTWVGEGVFRIAGWGRNGRAAVDGGLDYVLHHGGWGLLLGVDIYKLTAMHYVEDDLPREISGLFAPGPRASELYPPDRWFVEGGRAPVRAWYTIQSMAWSRASSGRGASGRARSCSFPCGRWWSSTSGPCGRTPSACTAWTGETGGNFEKISPLHTFVTLGHELL